MRLIDADSVKLPEKKEDYDYVKNYKLVQTESQILMEGIKFGEAGGFNDAINLCQTAISEAKVVELPTIRDIRECLVDIEDNTREVVYRKSEIAQAIFDLIHKKETA